MHPLHQNSRASPIIQLFDTASGTSLLFEGHTLRFAQLTLGNNCLPSNLLVYSSATSSPWKHILKVCCAPADYDYKIADSFQIIDTSCHVDDSIQFCNKPAVNAAFSTKDTDSPASIHVRLRLSRYFLNSAYRFRQNKALCISRLQSDSCTFSTLILAWNCTRVQSRMIAFTSLPTSLTGDSCWSTEGAVWASHLLIVSQWPPSASVSIPHRHAW